LHESVVQGLPSSQFVVLPWQTPALQRSLVVQVFPSLHAAVLFVYPQPVSLLHESLVQMFPSLQFNGAPPTHLPALLQVSFVEHVLPSSHAAPVFGL
jgi:hypothetical protein